MIDVRFKEYQDVVPEFLKLHNIWNGERLEGQMIQTIIKRDGRCVLFDADKIASAIFKAAQALGGNDYEWQGACRAGGVLSGRAVWR